MKKQINFKDLVEGQNFLDYLGSSVQRNLAQSGPLCPPLCTRPCRTRRGAPPGPPATAPGRSCPHQAGQTTRFSWRTNILENVENDHGNAEILITSINIVSQIIFSSAEDDFLGNDKNIDEDEGDPHDGTN